MWGMRLGHPSPLFLLLLLAFAASLAAAQDTASPCYYKSHFTVAAAAAAATCAAKCKEVLESRKNIGSIYPEIYKIPKTGETCCKCQYHATPFVGDPSPGSGTDADPSSDDKPATSTTPTKTTTKTPTTKTDTKKKAATGFKKVWWKVAIGVGFFIIIFCITLAMLFWDCCPSCCRRRTKVADSKEAAKEAREGKDGKKKGSNKRDTLSKEAQRRLAALDLARDMRGTKLEAQPPARFIEADARVNDDVEVVVATAPASAPTSPARQRRQRGFATLV